MMRRSAFFVALALIVGTGVVHGLWTDRWQASANSDTCADRLSRLPMTLGDGDWSGRALELDPIELERGGVVYYIARDYVNSRTKNEVEIVLMCGKTGPICAHTPDVCFEGAGYRMIGAPEKFSPPNSPSDSFWFVNFAKDGTEGQESVRVFWSWNPADHWQAADYPRMTFARYPALLKMYVSRRVTRPNQRGDRDACLDFLEVLLPELKKCLFPET